MGTAGAWLGRSEEVAGVGECKLAILCEEGTCPEQNATEGMCRHDLHPRDSLPSFIVLVLFWPTGTQCHGILNDVGQGGWLSPSPWLYQPINVSSEGRAQKVRGARSKGDSKVPTTAQRFC